VLHDVPPLATARDDRIGGAGYRARRGVYRKARGAGGRLARDCPVRDNAGSKASEGVTGTRRCHMPPTKLAHLVFQTNQIGRMRDWYCATLDAQVVHENPSLCFVTYDDEHHRIAFIDPGPLAPRAPILPGRLVDTAEPPGLHHVAFTYPSMGAFLDNYVRLKALGIVPFRCINHGPTTSMYYRDPDGNRVELQIDNFATAQEGRDWLSTPAFAENPIGVEYDPDQLVARFRAGVPVAELVIRDPVPAA
jgi:catechol 2,3-dioxygenase-like lactoylglutathione lyase family enzyme